MNKPIRFKVITKRGREKILEALNLDHAEKRCQEKGIQWEDIKIANPANYPPAKY